MRARTAQSDVLGGAVIETSTSAKSTPKAICRISSGP
jgi:hypothetical protein